MPRWFAWPSELKEAGILGINRRNLAYILESNPRRFYPRVDNKLQTKRICEANNIPIPKTYAVLGTHGDISKFPDALRGQTDFVIKPASGAAGRGIMVIAEQVGDIFLTPSGRGLTSSDIRYHLSTVISGLHSLGGQPDQAIIEQRIVTHPALDAISIGGTPDVRIILYRGVPVMGMLRLPTNASGGRANLHQGAIAAAIDLSTGRTHGGVCNNRAIDIHPDTQNPIGGVALPDWRRLIESAMSLGDALQLGYLGVDYVIDAEVGPVVLEANARPGLAIQVANRVGLRPRLDRIRALPPEALVGEARWDLIAEMCDPPGLGPRRVTLADLPEAPQAAT